MEMQTVYFKEIVYLRAIAILAVISIHVSAIFQTMDNTNFITFLYMSIDVFSHFGVPLFICISGFVLYNKYHEQISILEFYKKRFKSVVPQYTFFSIFAFSIIYASYIMKGEVWDIDALKILYMYLTGGIAIPFWFFFVDYPVISSLSYHSKSVSKILREQKNQFIIWNIAHYSNTLLYIRCQKYLFIGKNIPFYWLYFLFCTWYVRSSNLHRLDAR
jgi:peptidoglycan/LPS O-acetylase OafA/YrhL